MKHILLLGAGFSKNWGGWLASEVDEYLHTLPAIHGNPYLLELLSRVENSGGFEEALAQVQRSYVQSPTDQNLANLHTLQGSILTMFADMDAGFARRTSLNFTSPQGFAGREFTVALFLARFDAIFTLNQDLLLERHYHNLDLALMGAGKWNGWERPGIQTLSVENRWTPRDLPFVRIQTNQPVFKLHGSSDWWTENGEPMLIMGGDKVSKITRYPLLNWYQDQFETLLSEPGTKLMTIGYGGADQHINKTIAHAHDSGSGLSLFNIHPRGWRAVPEPLRKLKNIGSSSRPLSETFAGDLIELNKIYRFFTSDA